MGEGESSPPDLAAAQAASAPAPAAVTQADALRRRFEMAAAEGMARRAVEESPGYAAGRLVLGRVLLATRRLDEALTQFGEASHLAPDWEDAVVWQIASLSRQRRFDEAIALGKIACEETFPAGVLVRVALGRCYLDAYRPLDALPHLAKATQLRPDEMRAVRWHAEALANLFSWVEGDELTQSAVTRNPANARAHVIRGLFLKDKGHYPAAFGALDRAYLLDPDDPLLLEWRVTALRYLGRWDAAVDAAADAVSRYPLAPRLHVERAWTFRGLDRDREALACVDQALAIDPGDGWALESKIYILRHLERYREASQFAAEALERRADCVDVHVAAARASRNHDVALGHISRALALDPRNADALLYLITRLGGARRFAEAEQVAGDATGFHPYAPVFAVALAGLYEGPDERRDNKCEQALQDALRIAPTDEAALLAQGALLIRTGRADVARAVFGDFLSAAPDDPARYLAVAGCYADARQYMMAVKYADDALAIDPPHADALRRKVDYLRYAHRLDDAEQAALLAIVQRPDDIQMKFRLGQFYFDVGRYHAALAVLSRLPGDSYIHLKVDVLRAVILARTGRRRAAARLMGADSSRKTDPQRSVARSDFYQAEKRYKRALDPLGPVVRNDPEHEGALLDRATLLLKLYRWDDAQAEFTRLLTDVPRDAYKCVDISLIYSREGLHDDAARYAQRALMIDPAYRTAHRNLAYHLAQAGRAAEARQAASSLVEAYPDDPLAHLYVSYAFEELGDYEAGLAHAEQAVILDSDPEDALSQRFDLLLSLRRYDDARLEAERITGESVTADNIDLLERLAGSAERSGQLDMAMMCRRRSAELGPQDIEVITAQAELFIRLERYREARSLLEGIRGTPLLTAETMMASAGRIERKPDSTVQALSGLYAEMGLQTVGYSDVWKSQWQLLRDRSWWRTGGPISVIRRRMIKSDERVIRQWEGWSANTNIIETLPGLKKSTAETARAECESYLLDWSRHRRRGDGFVVAARSVAWVSMLVAGWVLLYFSILPDRVTLSDLTRATVALAVVAAAACAVFAFNHAVMRKIYLRWRKAIWVVAVCATAVVLAFWVEPLGYLAGHVRIPDSRSLLSLAASGALIAFAIMNAWLWLLAGIATIISDLRAALFQRWHARSAILDNLLDVLEGISQERQRNDLTARSNWIWLLEQTARRLERDLPRYYGKLDPHTATWTGYRATGSARWVRSLKQHVILPANGSWERLDSSLRHMAAKVADGDFAGLRWVEPVPVARERRLITYAQKILRILTVMAVPGLAVVITGLIVPLTGGTYRSATLLSLGWAVFYLLLSIDPTLRDKIDTARGLLDAVRGSAKPGPPTLPDAGDKRLPDLPLESRGPRGVMDRQGRTE